MYRIKTPNPGYTGITAGVSFVNGEAVVDEGTALRLGIPLPQLVRTLISDFGYELVEGELPPVEKSAGEKCPICNRNFKDADTLDAHVTKFHRSHVYQVA